jgi:tetratricopeptide (TPR) repeat protein
MVNLKKIERILKHGVLDYESYEPWDEAYDEGDVSKALLEVNKKLSSKPKNTTLLDFKASILEEMGRWDEAKQCYDLILKSKPKNQNSMINKSRILVEEEDGFIEGLDVLEEYFKIRKKFDSGALHLKARALFELGKHTQSLKICDEIIEKNPDDVDTIQLQFEIFYYKKNYKKSLQIIEKLIKLDSDDMMAMNEKANVLIKLKKFEDSIKISDRILSYDSTDDIAWVNKGEALFESGNTKQALRCLDNAIEFDSTNDAAWYERARILSILEKYDDALDSLLVSVSLGADFEGDLNKEPAFKKLHDSKRFKKILDKFNDQIN